MQPERGKRLAYRVEVVSGIERVVAVKVVSRTMKLIEFQT